MAVPPAFDAVSTDHASGSPTSLSFAHACSGLNRLLLVSVHLRNTVFASPSVGGVSYNGVPLTFLAGVTKTLSGGGGTEHVRTEIWYLVAPATGSHTVAITGVVSALQIDGAAMSFTGVDPSSPIRGSATASGSNTSPSVTISSASGDLVVDGVANVLTHAPVEAAGQTLLYALGGALIVAAGGSTKPGAASVAMSWTITAGSIWATAAVSLMPAARAAFASFAELEVPLGARSGFVSFAELEVPLAPRAGHVSFAELEVPDVPPPAARAALIAYATLEVPPSPGGGKGRALIKRGLV